MNNLFFLRILAVFIDLALGGWVAIFVAFISKYTSSQDLGFEGGIVFMLLKDMFYVKGSIGKKICGLELRKSKEIEPVSVFVKAFRNVFLFIYPIEFIVILFNKGQRLGDLIFGTEVVKAVLKD